MGGGGGGGVEGTQYWGFNLFYLSTLLVLGWYREEWGICLVVFTLLLSIYFS